MTRSAQPQLAFGGEQRPYRCIEIDRVVGSAAMSL
jgi:hypothetical protein